MAEIDDEALTEPIELLITPPTEVQKRRAWRDAVLTRFKNLCAGCGAPDHLSVDFIVPESAGGRLVEENGVTVCRACQVATKAASKAAETGIKKRRPVNVWLSRSLYDRLTKDMELATGFRSMGSLVRYMMDRVVAHPDLFEDMTKYQDSGMDVKINVWVDPDAYTAFKTVLAERSMTVADAVKALFCMYLDYMTQRRH